MNKALCTIAAIIITFSISLQVAFAKGGGFGALMAERSKMLFEEGYKAGHIAGVAEATATCTSNSAIIFAILSTLVIGVGIGYLIGKRKK